MTDRIARFNGCAAATGRLLGLLSKGWERGEFTSAGAMTSLCRRVCMSGGHDCTMTLTFANGIVLRNTEENDRTQIIESLTIHAEPSGVACFDEIGPVVASEIVRDVSMCCDLEVY